ncbi:unnamed protein product [Urochloa decumbens]|uniref:Amine oxidase domain-containing protein n=1 Tax=Urochloa decumbens TaxID=240449 RepID=A0ABC8YCB8_9POAL
MKPSVAIAVVLVIALAHYASLTAAAGSPKVIIVGAGMSGISAGKRLSDAGITDLVILEATDRIGGRMHKTSFAGLNVEMGANWVEGVGGEQMNPICAMANETLQLRIFHSDYDHIARNTYKQEYISTFMTFFSLARMIAHQVYLGKLCQVVREVTYSPSGVTVKTEENEVYRADYVMVSVSLGVLQTDLIRFTPQLPAWKIINIYQFDMALYTKIFLEFPKKFWPEGPGTEFFLYASGRRGYYPIWQHFEKQYPGSNVLLVTVTDDESRRIEQQPDNQTKAEAVAVLRKMFPGKDVPDATDILVPRWWSNRFFKGTFSNWPISISRYEYDLIRAPVGRVYFTGEHTSEHYNGYVHGAYLAGIDSADILINCANKKMCKYHVQGKYN